MNTNQKAELSPDGQRMLESLRHAVGKALERKRRLGQYAVIWLQGKSVIIEAKESRVAEESAPWQTDC